MGIALDAFDALKRIGSHAETFRPVRADADKAARTVFVKMLKANTTGLDDLRAVRLAFGEETFDHLFDGLKDTEIKSVLTRLDKHSPAAKETGPARARHLRALAGGEAELTPKPAKAPKRPAKPKLAKSSRAGSDDADLPRLRSDVVDLFRSGGGKKGKRD